MNKLLIVLLAICLVSVHAFVKRDAPVTEKDLFKDIGEEAKKIGVKINDEIAKILPQLKPDEMKKKVDEILDTITKGFKGTDKPQQ